MRCKDAILVKLFKERAREAPLRYLTGETTDIATVVNKRKRRRQQNSNQNKKKHVKQAENLKQRKQEPAAKVVLREPPAKIRRRALSRAALNPEIYSNNEHQKYGTLSFR